MEVVIGDCPLGAKCEDVEERNGRKVIVRCPWYVNVIGPHPQKARETIDNWGCAIAWGPILTIENTAQVRGAAKAGEQTRNVLAAGFGMTQVPVLTEQQLKQIGGPNGASDDHSG